MVEAQVERVEHRADRGDGQVRLEMLVAGPRERRDAIARADAEIGEGDGQPLHAVHDLGVGVVNDAPVGPPARDTLVGKSASARRTMAGIDSG